MGVFMNLAKKFASVWVAASLIAAPLAAQAAESAAPVRSGSEVQGENLRGGFIIPLVAVIAIILGILAMTGGDNDPPHSP
jgi:hypothetical protein